MGEGLRYLGGRCSDKEFCSVFSGGRVPSTVFVLVVVVSLFSYPRVEEFYVTVAVSPSIGLWPLGGCVRG